MESKLKKIYYLKPEVQQKKRQKKWLMRQPLYQIHLPPPKYIPGPNASMILHSKPNDIHQADILYLPYDKYRKKIYKYALNIVDVASRYKGSYKLTTENSKEVAQAFSLDIWKYIINLSNNTDN